ncbi:MAG: hypothetical protein ABWY11_03425, partial [Umezawaea sp.]
HQPTIAYVARRTTEGKTKAEIIRCLKRLLARKSGHCYVPCATSPPPQSRRLDNYRSVNALMESTR